MKPARACPGPFRAVFNIFSPPQGDKDAIGHFDVLSSSEKKIASPINTKRQTAVTLVPGSDKPGNLWQLVAALPCTCYLFATQESARFPLEAACHEETNICAQLWSQFYRIGVSSERRARIRVVCRGISPDAGFCRTG